MTRRVRFRPEAQRDLDRIWAYSLEHWGERHAVEYVGVLRAAFDLIGTNPGMARNAQHGRPGLKKFLAGSHVLYFHVGEKTIDVVRILHGRMDPKRHI